MVECLRTVGSRQLAGKLPSALNYFQSGQTDQAVQELPLAAANRNFRIMRRPPRRATSRLTLAAGFSVADAKAFGPALNPQTPMNGALGQLGQDMVALANGYQQSGDPASAQAAFQMTVNLAVSLTRRMNPARSANSWG